MDSPSVSRSHYTVEREGDGVRVRDDGSKNGTFLDGVEVPPEGLRIEGGEAVVLAGGVAITLRRDFGEILAPAPGTLHNLTPARTAPYNRPPRPGRPPPPEPVRSPVRKDPPPPTHFGIAAFVGPLLLAFAMVLVMGDPRYALLSGLSPVLGIGTWLEQKRRRAHDVKAEEKRFAEALNRFRDDVRKAAAAERARRRDECPDPVTTLRRAALPTTRLWQRRPGLGDRLLLHAGVGDVPWMPPVDAQSVGRLDDAVKEAIATARMRSAPVEVDLTGAGVVGVAGDRAGALAVARSLVCQAAVHCGPADPTVGVFCDPGRQDEWSWTAWLPHVRRLGDGSGGQWLSSNRQRSEALLRSLRDGVDTHPTPVVLLVIDSDVLTEGRDSPARNLLGYGRPVSTAAAQTSPTQVCGIVIAATEEQLLASCTVVVHVREDAEGTATRPGDLTTVDDVVLAGLDIDTARQCALDLARFDDPEVVVPGASLPSLVRLPTLLGMGEMTCETVLRSWGSSPRMATPIGVGEGGVFVLDLIRDGPHGLVGGTTGSGKSEFLRSLVAGLAARNDPTRLTFILIDFKGGAAFATSERLPHTIGTVSNLDEKLADRALRALEAELRYRQGVFAAAGEGIDTLDAYLATDPSAPMPRLLVVVDEFAMLAKEYPDVLSALVSVAAVGRTLGVHLILATQRPAGVVNDDILANTNLRVALRVQSRDDSVHVIGVPAAASIGRTQMGRAFVKLGQDDITPVQTALVTGRSERQSATPVDLRPASFGDDSPSRAVTPVDESAQTDLDLLIEAIVQANEQAGYPPPRPVWPQPLGARVELAAMAATRPDGHLPHPGAPRSLGALPVVGGVDGSVVVVALADDPDRQRQVPVGWDLTRGNLLLMGIAGSGTSTTLASIALTLAEAYPPDQLDLLILDMGSGELAPLAALPHTAAYVPSGSRAREQQVRLIRHLSTELDRRRATPGPHRRTVVLLDGLAALKEEYEDYEGLRLLDALYRVYAEGPALSLWCAATTARAKAVPGAIAEVTSQKWLFHLADVYDYAAAGVPAKNAPARVPGRCVLAETRLQAHVATPSASLPEAASRLGERWGQGAPKPTVVGQLPESIAVADLGVVAHVSGDPWRIPVGMRESDLTAGVLEAYDGEHLLIAGPARSGKSTVLLALAETLRAGAHAEGGDLAIWGVCGRRSPLADAHLERTAVGDQGLAALLASARLHAGPLVLLVDDAEAFDDADDAFAGLLSGRQADLHVVAAGRSDELRGLCSHWTRTVRKSRCGVLLQPNVDLDGELLGVTLPRRAPVALTPGRGYLARRLVFFAELAFGQASDQALCMANRSFGVFDTSHLAAEPSISSSVPPRQRSPGHIGNPAKSSGLVEAWGAHDE